VKLSFVGNYELPEKVKVWSLLANNKPPFPDTKVGSYEAPSSDDNNPL